jgi:hypothetical protein
MLISRKVPEKGFPHWHAFEQIMPRLAKEFTVIAVELQRVGGSVAF